MLRTAALLRLITLMLILYAFLMLWDVSRSLAETKQELQSMEIRAAELRQENRHLQAELSEIDEGSHWESIAREQLGLLGPEEIVIYSMGD